MGTNTLTARTDGEIIPASDHNELVQALLQDLVPRNASRAAQDQAGNLGASLLRWLRVYALNYHIGDAANNLKIYEGAPNEIWIERGSATNELIKIKSNSIDFLFGGSLIVSLAAGSLNSIDKYINHDKLKTKAKIAIGEGDPNQSETDYTNFANITLNSCVQGKKIIIDFTGAFLGEVGDLDLRIQINSATEITWADILPNTIERTIRKTYSYTVPSNGNYQIELQWRDATLYNYAYRIEEV